MKRFALLCLTFVVVVTGAQADEDLQRIQSALAAQGFFYGKADGNPSGETTQAIRRFQIRNSLAVTGELNDATRRAIGSAGDPRVPAEVPAPAESRPPAEPTPPPASIRAAPARPDLRADPSTAPRVRRYENDPVPAPAIPRPSTAPRAVTRDGASVFAGGPFENAPPFVQTTVLGQAQTALSREGFYTGETDGAAGPRTSQALREYQNAYGLPSSGRLDPATLDALGIAAPVREARVPAPRPPAGRPRVVPNSRYLGNGVYEGRIVPDTSPR